MSAGNPLAGFVRAMRHRDYCYYTVGSVASLVGTWVHRVALGWLTWEITHSYAWLGVIAFSDMFAMMVFSPLAGDLADRMDRLRLHVWSQVAMLAQAIAMAALYYAGLATIWVVFALTLMLGVMHAYHTASRLALVPNLVPREDLTPAIAINSLIFNVARFVGPAMAGLIIVNLGIGPAFVFNAATFVVFLAALLTVKTVRTEAPPGMGGGMLSNIAEGVRYSMRHPGIGPVLLVLAVTAFTGRALPDLLPGFADGVFARGAEGLAWMTAAMGLGATLSGFYFLARDGVRGMTAIVVGNIGLMGVSCLAFAAWDSFWAGVALLVVAGFAMNNTSIGTLNLMQNAVEGQIRGRVMSIYSVIQQGAPAAGTLVLGAVAEYTGLPWPVAVSAAFSILLWAVMTRRTAAMRGALETEAPATAAPAGR
ncbi:MAG TPA: MFS transporter [Alphaproteobacteria bacterium]